MGSYHIVSALSSFLLSMFPSVSLSLSLSLHTSKHLRLYAPLCRSLSLSSLHYLGLNSCVISLMYMCQTYHKFDDCKQVTTAKDSLPTFCTGGVCRKFSYITFQSLCGRVSTIVASPRASMILWFQSFTKRAANTPTWLLVLHHFAAMSC